MNQAFRVKYYVKMKFKLNKLVLCCRVALSLPH